MMRRFRNYFSHILFLRFFAGYESVADLNAALSSEKVEGIFMERIQAYYYYKDSNDENLRIFKAINAKISYKMALKTNTMLKFIVGNSCIKRRLEHPLIDRLIKNYTKPMKVLNNSVLRSLFIHILHAEFGKRT